MFIRQEEPKDYDVVYRVVKCAFENADRADGNEQDLVNALRKGESFIPELSLVAEVNGTVAAHIMFTRATVGNNTVLALAPLSVLPQYQRKGIGAALINEGHGIAKRLGYEYSVVLGSAEYYPRMGYAPADLFGIHPPFDVPRENFMACRIIDSAADISGIMRYASEFNI